MKPFRIFAIIALLGSAFITFGAPELAIQLGAKPITWRESGEMVLARRKNKVPAV